MANRSTHGMTVAEKLAYYSTRPSNDACWEWQGARNSAGYGHLGLNRKHQMAHRLAWQEENGPIPAGLFICHHCDNRRCINPKHLFLGTSAENLADMRRKGRGKAPQPVYGEKHPSSKFTDETIRAVRSDPRPQREIASHYGMSTGWVSYIKRGVYRTTAGDTI